MEGIHRVITEQQNAIDILTQRLQELQAPHVRYNLKFDTFSYEGANPAQDYDRFEQNVRMVSQVMGYQVPGVCFAIIGQLRGQAADMARSLVGTENDYPNLNTFLNRLRQLFVSPAYQEKARSLFLSRIQRPGETIIGYHGTLRALWEKAYNDDERQEITLVRQFIAGIQDARVNERLHLTPPDDYNNALQEALRLEGTYEVIQLEAKRRSMNGRSHMSHTQTFSTPNNGPQPMEIGNVAFRNNQQQKGMMHPNQFGPRRFQNQKPNTQWQPPSRRDQFTSRVSTPRTPVNRDYGFKGNYQNQQRRNTTVAAVAQDECLKCHQKGHWAKNCRVKSSIPKRPWEDRKPPGNTWKPNQYNNQPKMNNAAKGNVNMIESNDSGDDSKNGLDWM